MSIDKEYRALLLDISHGITPRELEEMKFLCYEMIPESRLEDADILHFFRELEKQDKLRYDNLDWLVYMLEKVKRQDLVFRLQSYQFFQRTYFGELGGRSVTSTAYHREPAQQKNIINNIEFASSNDCPSTSSEDQSASLAEPAEVTVRCVVKLVSVGAWLAGSGYILSKYQDDPDALVNLVTKAVLPAGLAILYIVGGSVKFVLRAMDLCALRELWNRYNSNQLRKDLEKVLVTDDLVKYAGGETIEFSVEIDENEYRNACLGLIVAYNKAQRKVATTFSGKLQRSSSSPDLTSICIQSPSVQSQVQKRNSSLVTYGKAKRLAELRADSSASSGHFSSSFSSGSGDDRHVFLSDFLQNSEKVQDVCAILDREMILCHDWRSLASEFGYKMKEICLLERKESPSMALLEDITHKSPDAKLSELINKLSYLERDDVVDQIEGSKDDTIPESLANLPFIVRKKIALELDHATTSQFTEVVHNLASSIRSGEIMALQKRPSPTMALLEELETVYPSLHISHLEKACLKGGIDAVSDILQEYSSIQKHFQRKTTKTDALRAKRASSLKKLKIVGGDSGVGLSTPQSPT